MKVLVVSNLYPPNSVGGYERLCALVANALAARGHQVSVLTSDFGSTLAAADLLPVERRLRLPVNPSNIYRPFDGTIAERAAMSRQNLMEMEASIERNHPDVILVGNLYFLDASILEPLRRRKSVIYLLTDVWMIHFTDQGFLESYFKNNVLDIQPGTPPLVPELPSRLKLTKVEVEVSAEAEARTAEVAFRHRQVETRIAAGRDAFQMRGTCHLCGPTSFLIRREGPATIMLPARSRTLTICAKCGLDAPARSVLHVLDMIAAPAVKPAEILVASSSPSTQRCLRSMFPLGAISDLGQAGTEPGERYQHVVCVDDSLPDLRARLHKISTIIEPGGTVVLGESCWPRTERPGSRQGDALDGRFRETTAYAIWSETYGYLGRELIVHVARDAR